MQEGDRILPAGTIPAATNPKLDGRLAGLRAKAEAKAKNPPAPDKSPPRRSNVVQLPMWPEPVRAVPNGVLRSALFGAIGKGPRRYMRRELVAAVDGVGISYTGERLDQGDLDVWESVLHAVRLQKLGSHCHLTAYALLKLMGKTDTGENRKTLDARLSRMKATGVEVKAGGYSYEGSLIDGVYRAEATREYVIQLNPKLRSLFAPDQFSHIGWNVRRALDGHQLAQWLHGFYASHAKPHPMKAETLLKLAGSENASPSSARQKLRKALDAVAEASAANGEGFGYDVRGDLVHVEKRPSGPQRRHLAKKADLPRKPRG